MLLYSCKLCLSMNYYITLSISVFLFLFLQYLSSLTLTLFIFRWTQILRKKNKKTDIISIDRIISLFYDYNFHRILKHFLPSRVKHHLTLIITHPNSSSSYISPTSILKMFISSPFTLLPFTTTTPFPSPAVILSLFTLYPPPSFPSFPFSSSPHSLLRLYVSGRTSECHWPCQAWNKGKINGVTLWCSKGKGKGQERDRKGGMEGGNVGGNVGGKKKGR